MYFGLNWKIIANNIQDYYLQKVKVKISHSILQLSLWNMIENYVKKIENIFGWSHFGVENCWQRSGISLQ